MIRIREFGKLATFLLLLIPREPTTITHPISHIPRPPTLTRRDAASLHGHAPFAGVPTFCFLLFFQSPFINRNHWGKNVPFFCVKKYFLQEFFKTFEWRGSRNKYLLVFEIFLKHLFYHKKEKNAEKKVEFYKNVVLSLSENVFNALLTTHGNNKKLYLLVF